LDINSDNLEASRYKTYNSAE